MIKIHFECDTPGCLNIIQAEVPLSSPRSESYRGVNCTNCKAIFHVRVVIVREDVEEEAEEETPSMEPETAESFPAPGGASDESGAEEGEGSSPPEEE